MPTQLMFAVAEKLLSPGPGLHVRAPHIKSNLMSHHIAVERCVNIYLSRQCVYKYLIFFLYLFLVFRCKEMEKLQKTPTNSQNVDSAFITYKTDIRIECARKRLLRGCFQEHKTFNLFNSSFNIYLYPIAI